MSEQQENIITKQNEQPKAFRVFAGIVSYICHPVFMPIIMAYVLTLLSPASFLGIQPKEMGLWFISVGVTAVFFPLFSIALMKPLGFIESYHMPTAKERTIPLMVTMIFYFWISHVFNNIPHVPLIFKVLMLGNLWGVVVLFIINIFTKISMHTAAAGGMLGIIIVLMITSPANMALPFFVALVIAGIIGSARLVLGAHQKGDVWLGYVIGILAQLSAFVFMKYM